jgi:transcriptional regulator of acetoin/glycerol metabolism
VRELSQLIKGLALMSESGTIDAAMVWQRLELKAFTEPLKSEFSVDELSRLSVMRRHGFDARKCAADAAYGASRATIDRHLRVFICRALYLRDWNITEAARLLADAQQSALVFAVERRIRHFLSENLSQRLEMHSEHPSSQDGLQAWEKALREQYKTDYPLVADTIAALRDGRLRIEPPRIVPLEAAAASGTGETGVSPEVSR